MALTKTPVCDFGKKAEDFKLRSIDNKIISLNDIKGNKATLIMFICNHCPYVKAIIKDLSKECEELRKDGVNSIAIMSNDTKNYPEDSFDNMIKFAKAHNFGKMNYLFEGQLRLFEIIQIFERKKELIIFIYLSDISDYLKLFKYLKKNELFIFIYLSDI